MQQLLPLTTVQPTNVPLPVPVSSAGGVTSGPRSPMLRLLLGWGKQEVACCPATAHWHGCKSHSFRQQAPRDIIERAASPSDRDDVAGKKRPESDFLPADGTQAENSGWGIDTWGVGAFHSSEGSEVRGSRVGAGSWRMGCINRRPHTDGTTSARVCVCVWGTRVHSGMNVFVLFFHGVCAEAETHAALMCSCVL